MATMTQLREAVGSSRWDNRWSVGSITGLSRGQRVSTMLGLHLGRVDGVDPSGAVFVTRGLYVSSMPDGESLLFLSERE